jgi:hypothetical protein
MRPVVFGPRRRDDAAEDPHRRKPTLLLCLGGHRATSTSHRLEPIRASGRRKPSQIPAACLALAYRDSERDETEDGARSTQAA